MIHKIYKYALIIPFYLLLMVSAFGQKPQIIEGIAKERKSVSYYKEQSTLWKQVVDKDKKDGDAWMQYYKANRARYQLEFPELWSDNRLAFYAKLDPIIQESKNSIGNSYDYYSMKGLNSEGAESVQALEKAYEIDPDRQEVHGWLLSYYFPRFQDEKCRTLAKSMLKSNEYSNACMLWNQNALASCEQNAVMIANGDMDGLPKIVLQYGKNVRPDVLTVSKWLLGSIESYRKEIFKRLGLSDAPKISDDFESFAKYVDYLTYYLMVNSDRPTYMMVGTPKQFFKDYDLDDNMYVVGNVLKYDADGVDNTKELVNNFENVYYLEYLLQNYQQHPEDSVVKESLNLSYLPAFFTLKKYYKSKGHMEAVDLVTRYTEVILEQSGRGSEVRNWFENY